MDDLILLTGEKKNVESMIPRTSYRRSFFKQWKAFNNILYADFEQCTTWSAHLSLTPWSLKQHITALLPSFQTLLADHSARHSLTGLPYTSAELLPSDSDATTNLQSAYKLRHRALFRECFIYIVGPWSYPQDKQSPDEPLFRLADATYQWKESLESAAEKFTQRTREMNLRSRLQA